MYRIISDAAVAPFTAGIGAAPALAGDAGSRPGEQDFFFVAAGA
jgi:hypothetical protein